MGYRHYIGYIPKDKFKYVLEKLNTNANKDDVFFEQILDKDLIKIAELGKLYSNETGEEMNAIIHNSNYIENRILSREHDYIELLTIKKSNIMLKLSKIMFKSFANFVKEESDEYLSYFIKKSFSRFSDEELISNDTIEIIPGSYLDMSINLWIQNKLFDWDKNILIIFAW